MEQAWCYLIYLAVPILFFLFKFILQKQSPYKNLPPSPPSFPVIGHLHLIKNPVHRTLDRISQKYGPILTLWFGNRRVIVVSSPSIVEECFTKNDIVLANRPSLLISRILAYNNTTMGNCSYGDHWRNLRKFSTQEIFSASRLNSFANIRHEEVQLLLKNLFQFSGQNNFKKVEMKSRLSELSFNIIMRMVAGKRYFGLEGEDFEEAKLFRSFIKEFMEIGGVSNPGDFLPFMQLIDYGNLEKKMRELQKQEKLLAQGLVDEHREKNKSCSNNLDQESAKTMIDSMLILQMQDPEKFSDDIIKGHILTMIAAGTDTTSVTMEWAMSLLLNHPKVLEKARAELDENISTHRLVQESDLPNLPYLQSIIKETLRLYPAAPLLLPHESSQDCTILGYTVPSNSMLFVNAWAIHRDPSIWDDPTSFKPERFENIKGEDLTYKLIPFGLGRRQCPGARLANQMVGLTIATLIQCFEWERIGEELVDLCEGQGITMPKAKPLEALGRAREEMVDVLSKI